jgi:hypothetical protein
MVLSTGVLSGEVANMTPMPLWSRNSNGVSIVSSGVAPTFRLYSPDGRLIREVTAPARPVPITPEDKQILVTKNAEVIPLEGRQRVIESQLRSPMAANYPAYVAVILADDGAIWAQPPVKADDIRSGRVSTYDFRQNMGLNEWHVFAGSGELRWTVEVPRGFHLRRVVGNRLYGDALSSSDEPIVQILRVSPTNRQNQ